MEINTRKLNYNIIGQERWWENIRYNRIEKLIPEEGEQLYIIGQLTRSIPFLARTKKGTLVVPFYVETEDGLTMTNSGNAVICKDGKLIDVEIPPMPTSISKNQLRINSIAVNDDNGGEVKYFPFVGFGENALRLHTSVSKGDTVVALGRIQTVGIPGTSLTKDILMLRDVRLLRQCNATRKSSAVNVDDI